MLDRSKPLSARDALTIARIVRVNHAGEYGAIRIYSAQIGVSAKRYPDVVPALADMLQHEKKHCAAFFAAMPARQSRPCRIMSLWGWGGWLLGFATALMGPQAIWVCTAAVEAAVHRHLDDQLAFLAGRDAELHDTIMSIREEELSHLHHAEAQIGALGHGSAVAATGHLGCDGCTDLALDLGRFHPDDGRSAQGSEVSEATT